MSYYVSYFLLCSRYLYVRQKKKPIFFFMFINRFQNILAYKELYFAQRFSDDLLVLAGALTGNL